MSKVSNTQDRKEMCAKARKFLIQTEQFYKFCQLMSAAHWKPINCHSDRWSATYDWVHDGRFNGICLPDEIETCLTYYWEETSRLT